MSSILYILFGGLLTRADGWGPENDVVRASWPEWQRKLADFFNVWSCGGLFGVLSVIYTGNILAFAAGLSFVAWRLPGFDGWERWWPMWWRGFWTSAIGFTFLSLVLHHHPYYGLLAIAMGFGEMIYPAVYKWLPDKWYVHISAEIGTGLWFSGLTAIIFAAVEFL